MIEHCPVERQAEEQEALDDYRDRLEAESLQRVERVAEEVGVRGQHHQHVARNQEVAELQEIQRQGENRQRDDRKDQARAHEVLQIALDLGRRACALALIKDVEAKVEENGRHQRGDCHDRVEVAEAGVEQARCSGEHCHQCDQSRHDSRAENQDRVAEGS